MERSVLGNSGPTLAGITLRLLGATEERREHFLQACDEVIGLAGAFGQVFYLLVLDADLAWADFILAFGRRGSIASAGIEMSP